ncbi:putative flavonol synthase 4 [Silene latifolia]|uniref:putative flavonol synthase 4 n=1 Tax=Silene latifolia TaxID=37657 RepID=UPI003D7778F0
MKMSSTICSSPQMFLHEQDYNLIKDESEQIILDFRAPPPSPTGTSRRTSSVTNDGVLAEFLESSLRVPDLILPNRIFPRQKSFREIPVIDFQEIKNSSVSKIKECFQELGCFQVINHGISPELVKTVRRRASRIFRLSPERKRMAVRSPELPLGFEEVIEDVDDVIGELSEEFVWSKSNGLKVKMEGIWPLKYSKFSTKMESLERAIEKIAKDIMKMIMMNNQEDQSVISKMQHEKDGNICHIYKHPHGIPIDQCMSSLRCDVIRMMIRGSDYSHALSLHICDGSSEFHVYSKKGWTSFIPVDNALVVTCGDQIQAWSAGRYKHVIGKPIYTTKNKDSISMAFHFSSQRDSTINKHRQQLENPRIISLRDQALFALFLTIASQILLHIYYTF